MELTYFKYGNFNGKIFKKNKKVSLEDAQVLISLGGDGTLLRMFKEAHTMLGHKVFDKFFLGINLGTLGFLTCSKSLLNLDSLEEVLTKTYPTYRNVLMTNYGLRTYSALNEFVIYPRKRGSLFTVNVLLGQSQITYKGDGVIVSTSTGSTAYNLSANGPILFPNLKGVIISPICPFSLSDRPLVVPLESRIKIQSEQAAEIYCDGQFLSPLSDLELYSSGKELILLSEKPFPEIIKEKLGWNMPIK